MKDFTIIRMLGFLLGIFLIVSAITHNYTVSEAYEELPPKELDLLILAYTLASLPLVVPWRFIKWPAVWWPLFIILMFDVAAIFYKGVTDTVWAFKHGARIQQITYPILGFVSFLFLAVQILAVLHLRRKRLDPTYT